MPYIEKKAREQFEREVETLVHKLSWDKVNEPVSVGEVNFVLSSIIWKVWATKPSYTLGNNLIGALECVKQEFYRRQLAPYEDKKIAENGDI